MAAQSGIHRQYVDLPGSPDQLDLVTIEHGRGAEHLGAGLREGLDHLSSENPRIRRIRAELDYGNVMGALVELGRYRDSLALAMFPAAPLNPENVDDYLAAATHVFQQAAAIQRDKTAERAGCTASSGRSASVPVGCTTRSPRRTP